MNQYNIAKIIDEGQHKFALLLMQDADGHRIKTLAKKQRLTPSDEFIKKLRKMADFFEKALELPQSNDLPF
jgi:hypothetical protein